MPDRSHDTAAITELLIAWSDGRREALDRLAPIVYEDLRRLAAGYMQREPAGHALQPTALVHEAYLRLIDQRHVQWRNRAHFFGVAAQMMRRILVDHARQRHAEKRGGGVTIVGLEDVSPATHSTTVDVLALDQALDQLTAVDARLCRVVELRYFAGLNIDETACALDVSTATVERDWMVAKAWLFQRLSPLP
jgi:RNA polymerase sigma factor (TIGR02999 family)